jgi:hypothetical protein
VSLEKPKSPLLGSNAKSFLQEVIDNNIADKSKNRSLRIIYIFL